MANKNLTQAKKNKKDEFYTMLTDIEKELKHYKEQFKGKVVYCNCDDPEESEFWKFFELNFEEYGLKKLISTHYDAEKPTYKLELTGDTNGDGKVTNKDIVKTPLKQNGDFRSDESIELLKEADIVVTNPPFSLFREYTAQLMKYNKKFLIIGNQNAVTYKEIFPLIIDNKIWLGVNQRLPIFLTPLSEVEDPKKQFKENGKIFQKFGNICWFTNLPNKKRTEDLILTQKYDPKKYPKYDNYDAINVNKVADIPKDYKGVMGVPITFLYSYNPKQFKIVAFRKGEDGKDLVFTREREFNLTFEYLSDNIDSRNDKKQRRKNKWETYLCENPNYEGEPIDFFFPKSTNLSNGLINNQTINGKKGYCRILIQKI